MIKNKGLQKKTVGQTFRTADGVRFTVLQDEFFPHEGVGGSHRKYLAGLSRGHLVSVTYYGQPVPLITYDDGVSRLVEVRIKGKRIKGSLAISKVLHITQTRCPERVFLQ